MPWNDYALAQITEIIRRDGGYSARVSTMVLSLQGDPPVFTALLRYLESHNQQAILEQIRKLIADKPLFSIRGVDIIEMADGYAARKAGQNTPVQFTNFRIRIDGIIWFEQSQQTYLRGRLLLKNQQIPLLFSSTQMRQPKAFISQAQEALRACGLGSEVTMPVVTQDKGANRLAGVLAHEVVGKPRLSGVEYLGWNPAKTRFTAPCWEAQKSVLKPTAKVFHSRDKILTRWFTCQDYPLMDDFHRVGSQARYLIALVTAALTRAFLNLGVPSVRIMRSAQSCALLGAVFRPLGQVAPVELGPLKKRVRWQQFSGYPLYASGPGAQAAGPLNYPWFVLAKSGALLHEPISKDALAQVTGLSHRVFTSLVLKLLSDPVRAHALIQKDSAPSLQQLAQEGKVIIETLGTIERFELVAPELPLLESLLSEVSPTSASKYFRREKNGVIYIRCRNFPALQRKALFRELCTKNQETKLHGDHYIACSESWFSKTLERIYGRPINL